MDAVQAYRESEITGDNPVHLVVLLYDQVLRDLRRALDAFEKKDVERRCAELGHALLVLGQLQGSLNLDAGGEVAQNLDRFYDFVRSELLRASIEGAPERVEKQWRNLLGVREAWLEVERAQNKPAAAPAIETAAGQENLSPAGTSKWKA